MFTFTLTCWNRPLYLQQVIDSFRVCGAPEGSKLFVGMEPGNPEVARIIDSIDFVDKEVHTNDIRLGDRHNPYKTLCRAFDCGSDYNVYLEEDVLLSPDAIDLAEWYLENGPKEESGIICLNFMGKRDLSNKFGRQISDPSKPQNLYRSRQFNALGFCTSRNQWLSYFKPMWYKIPNGWDWSIIHLLDKNNDLRTLMPRLIRSMHIGADGLHSNPIHQKGRFESVPMSTERTTDQWFVEV